MPGMERRSANSARGNGPPGANRVRGPWAVTFLVLGVALAWILVMPSMPVAQPAAFNHARHKGVACTTCHRGAETSARAGIPELSDCQKCHATPPRQTGVAKWPSPGAARQISWIQVTRVPDHVMFSHRRHVVSGRLTCPSCHGDIGDRTDPPGAPPARLDMDGCLSCHRREGASEDCAGCHR